MALLAGMPSVETFAFRHGTTRIGSMSRVDEKSFRYPPLPSIVPPGETILWPRTLKHLELSNLDLETSAFASNMEMPESVETILLKDCGNNADRWPACHLPWSTCDDRQTNTATNV